MLFYAFTGSFHHWLINDYGLPNHNEAWQPLSSNPKSRGWMKYRLQVTGFETDLARLDNPDPELVYQWTELTTRSYDDGTSSPSTLVHPNKSKITTVSND